MAFKVLENTIKSMRGQADRTRVEFVCEVALAGIDHPRVKVRGDAFYRLAELAQVLEGRTCFQEWLGTKVFDACQRGLSDPGTDWDEHGQPIQDKGTLTLIERSLDVLAGLGREARSHRLFYGALQGLERANGFMACARLSPAYGRKLMDRLLDVLDRLISCEDPMPLVALSPDLFPNYLTEFLNMAASTEYRHVPLEPIMDLVGKVPRRRRYLWHIVEVVRHGQHPQLVDMLWAHLGREMNDGPFAAELKRGLRQSLADGHLPRECVPESLLPMLLDDLLRDP